MPESSLPSALRPLPSYATAMIQLTRLNGQRFVMNAEKIRVVESTPDTLVCCDGGEKVMVRETLQEVMRRAIEYARLIRRPIPHDGPCGGPSPPYLSTPEVTRLTGRYCDGRLVAPARPTPSWHGRGVTARPPRRTAHGRQARR